MYKDPLFSKLYRANRLGVMRCRENGTYYHHVTSQQLLDLLKSQLFLCSYCDISIVEDFHLDHIQPLSRKGEHVLANLQFTCSLCNLEKHNKLDYTGTIYTAPPPLPEPDNPHNPDDVEEASWWS